MSSPKDTGPLLGSLLRLVYGALTQEVSRWLAESGNGDLQPAHLAVIQPLWDLPGGARLTTLARAARITKQSMSALVEHVERAGYVERIPDPDDGRAQRLRLTARGRSFCTAIRAFVRSVEADWARRVGPKRIDELRATLQLIVDATSDR